MVTILSVDKIKGKQSKLAKIESNRFARNNVR